MIADQWHLTLRQILASSRTVSQVWTLAVRVDRSAFSFYPFALFLPLACKGWTHARPLSSSSPRIPGINASSSSSSSSSSSNSSSSSSSSSSSGGGGGGGGGGGNGDGSGGRRQSEYHLNYRYHHEHVELTRHPKLPYADAAALACCLVLVRPCDRFVRTLGALSLPYISVGSGPPPPAPRSIRTPVLRSFPPPSSALVPPTLPPP